MADIAVKLGAARKYRHGRVTCLMFMVAPFGIKAAAFPLFFVLCYPRHLPTVPVAVVALYLPEVNQRLGLYH